MYALISSMVKADSNATLDDDGNAPEDLVMPTYDDSPCDMVEKRI